MSRDDLKNINIVINHTKGGFYASGKAGCAAIT